MRPSPAALVETPDRSEPHPEGAGPRARSDARLVALFVVYLGLLTWVVLWKLEWPWVGDQRVVKLVPFTATAGAGASSPFDVGANLLLFVPFGAYLGLLAPSRPWWVTGAVVAAASTLLETAQYLLGVGSTDVTDVVVNTAGGLVGLALLRLAGGALGAPTRRVVTAACALGTVVALLAAGLYVASPVRFVHVQDVGPLVRGDPPRGP